MKKLILILTLILALSVSAGASELTAPPAPDSVQELMPPQQETFGEGLWFVVKSAIQALQPDLAEACGVCLAAMAVVLLISVLDAFPGISRQTVQLAGTVALACLLLKPTHSLIRLASETIRQMSEYGKLLLPVMTSAMAAQGGITTSTALYVGTAFFQTLLSSAVPALLVPLVYLYLAISVANSAMEEGLLQKLGELLKWAAGACMKAVLYIFTGYISITGVISGSADKATLKATKLALSSAVPVVGGMLSDASETVIVGAGLVKNAVGVYGMLAVLAIAIVPFLRIMLQYLLFKLTAAICTVFGSTRASGLVQDYSGAMGLLLGMTGTVCLMLLIGIACFFRGIG